MKFSFLTVVFLLVLAEHNVLTDCPESGCECGEHCVDSNDLWCKSNYDSACSCKHGCLLYNILIPEAQGKEVYCVNSYCMSAKRNTVVTPAIVGCVPRNLKVGVDYPANDYNPNCFKEVDDTEAYLQ